MTVYVCVFMHVCVDACAYSAVHSLSVSGSCLSSNFATVVTCVQLLAYVLLCDFVCSKADVTSSIVIMNVYCPRAEPGNAERLEYKLRFYRLLQLRAEAVLASGR